MTFFTFNFKFSVMRRWGLWLSLMLSAALLSDKILFMIFHHPTPQDVEAKRLGNQTDIIFLGTSRTQTAVDPELISSKAVNISVPSITYAVMAKILKPVFLTAKNTKFFVFEFTLESLLYAFKDKDKFATSLDPFGVSKTDLQSKRDLSIETILSGLFPSVFIYRLTPRLFFADSIFASKNEDLRNGHKAFNRKINLEADLVRLKQGFLNIEKSRLEVGFQENRDAFFEILSEIKARNINLILLHYPVHSAYSEAMLPSWRAIKQEILFEAVEKKLLSQNYVIDNSQIFDGRQDVFSDMEHLNETGAKAFSQLLRKQMEELGAFSH